MPRNGRSERGSEHRPLRNGSGKQDPRPAEDPTFPAPSIIDSERRFENSASGGAERRFSRRCSSAPPLARISLHHANKDRDSRPAKSVDGLLRVADDHQLSRSEMVGIVRISRKQSHDFCLHLIRVLKFVHEDGLETASGTRRRTPENPGAGSRVSSSRSSKSRTLAARFFELKPLRRKVR